MALAVRQVVGGLAGTAEGGSELSRGYGGDITLLVDRASEETCLERLGRLATRIGGFSVISEEAGFVDLGASYPRVLMDPVDGSLNAQRGLPFYGFMIAAADGPCLGDVFAGLVVNLVTGEEFWATRGGGAYRNGKPLQARRAEPERIGVLGLESTSKGLDRAVGLVSAARRLRIMGSMALSLCHTAVGEMDLFCSPRPVRLFDCAAAMLIAGEAGAVVSDIGNRPLANRSYDLQQTGTLLVSAHRSLHSLALGLLDEER